MAMDRYAGCRHSSESMMKRGSIALIVAGLLASPAVHSQSTPAVPQVDARSTEPTQQGGANRAIIVSTPDGPVIAGTAELAGIELYDVSGARIGAVAAGEAASLDVRYDALALNGAPSTIIAVADSGGDALRFYTPRSRSLVDIGARPVPMDFALEGVCLYRSAEDGSLYAFAVGDGGEVEQYLLFESAAGKVDARKVRRLNLPSTAEHCVADDRSGELYVSEEAVGIWRFTAEPETDVAPALIDAARLGHIAEEVGGLALFDGGPGARWLIASNSSAGQLLVYDRSKDDSLVGAVTVGRQAAVAEPGGLFATSERITGLDGGALLVADEEAEGGARYRIAPFAPLASALGLSAGSPQPLATRIAPTFPIVRPSVETEPVAHGGDAADDPAIWRNPTDPSASLVIGTDKQGGLHVYDMSGKSLQYVPDGKLNNVDLREGFALGGEPIILVTASDRTNKAVAIYKLDPAARRLVAIADGVQASGLSDPYGQCMYRSPRTGKYYVFVSDPDGLVRQWELVATRSGKVRIKPVRDVKFASQTEGCVADDSSGTLYVGEEDIALWSVTAEPVPSAVPKAIDRVDSNPKLKDDLEGVGLYDLGGGRGYIVVSSQGNNSYAVYRRDGDHAYLGSFAIAADPGKGIDGVSETDGLDVSSADLGPGFEHGALVAQDGRNVLPVENQNFKIIPWQSIADALKLEVRQ
jgi:3-phytase